MTRTIRAFMLFQAATFVTAAAIHGGLLIGGYEHREARIAESIIAIALLIGVVVSWMKPAWTRTAGLTAQGFALFWTLVGLGTIVAGIGPQSPADIVYHIAIIAVLLWGLAVTYRSKVKEYQR